MQQRTWKDLGEMVKVRRSILNRTQEEVVAIANVKAGKNVLSTANLRIFEAGGRTSYRPSTLLGLALGLDLPVGTIDDLRNGADIAVLAGSSTMRLGATQLAGADVESRLSALEESVTRQEDALRVIVERLDQAGPL